MKMGRVVSKIFPGQIWSQWAFYVGPKGQGLISYTLLRVVPMSLRNKFPVNPVEFFFSKIDQNLGFDLFCPNQGKKGHKNMATEPIFYTLQKEVPMIFKKKFHVNPEETICKIYEDLNFDLFWPCSRSRRTQKYGPWGPIFYTLLKVFPVSLKIFIWIQWKPSLKKTKTDYWPHFRPIRGQKGP